VRGHSSTTCRPIAILCVISVDPARKTGAPVLRKGHYPWRTFLKLIIAFLATASLGAAAQEPPGRAGRLAFAEGSVSVYMDPDIGWEPGYVNVPITSENSVWTDVDSRAELRVSGLSLRLDETSQLDITELVDARLEATLARGAVNVRIRHFLNNDFIAINTPQARFILLSEGRYRIDSDPDRGDSRITVFEGRASMETRSGGSPCRAASRWWCGASDRPAYALQAVMTTDFDRWASARDSHWVETQAPRYVSTYMTGYEDLDAHGQWVQEPDYGPLWFPQRVAADWAPYSYGHWAWVRPWGWTWIDDQPWGYAPFHYGRWVHVNNRWGWYPGHRVERPVWAPALVAWVGGSNWSVGVRGSNAPVVGWYPLSPFERYQPWYRTNTKYVNNVNVNVVITNRDRAWRHADQQRDYVRTHTTVVQRDAFSSRRAVQQSVVQVAPEVMRQQPVAQQPTTMLPSRNDFVRANQGRAINRQAAPATTGTQPAQRGEAAAPPARATPPGANPLARGTTMVPGTPSAAPVIAPPAEKPRFARTPTGPAPQAAAAGATPPPPAPVTRAQPPGQERSRFGPGPTPPAPACRLRRRDRRRSNAAIPASRREPRAKRSSNSSSVASRNGRARSSSNSATAKRASSSNSCRREGSRQEAAREHSADSRRKRPRCAAAATAAGAKRSRPGEGGARRTARTAGESRPRAQQQQQQQAREAQQAQRSAREQQRGQQEKPPDAQQQQQQQAREAQQAQEKARATQQQRTAGEGAAERSSNSSSAPSRKKAAREAQQHTARPAREGGARCAAGSGESGPRRASSNNSAPSRRRRRATRSRRRRKAASRSTAATTARPAREGGAATRSRRREKAAREAQQQQQRAQQEKAARDAQQAQEKAAREAQQRAQQPPPQAAPPQAPPQAQPPQPPKKQQDKTDKEKDEEEKGKGNRR
jgi:hypothetical protein